MLLSTNFAKSITDHMNRLLYIFAIRAVLMFRACSNNAELAILQGRLDTLCAPECEQSLAPLHANTAGENVTDCSSPEYISSSGLRIFLSLLKSVKAKDGAPVLESVNKEIRNIFAIIGFSKFFTIKD